MTFVSYTENPLSKEDIKHTWKHGLVAVKVIHDISILIALNEKSFSKSNFIKVHWEEISLCILQWIMRSVESNIEIELYPYDLWIRKRAKLFHKNGSVVLNFW